MFRSVNILREVLPPAEVMRNREIHRISSTPCCDNVAQPEKDHCECVDPFRSLRSIAQRANQNDKEKTDVETEENLKYIFSSTCS